MMPIEIAKISSQVQQPAVRQTEVSVQKSDQARVVAAQSATPVARVNKLQQGQEAAATSGRVLPPDDQQQASKTDKESVQAAVSNIEDYVQSVNRDLKFSVDDDSGRVVVSVLDSETQEVIRQIPSEEALDMARKLQDSLGDESGGLLFRDNA